MPQQPLAQVPADARWNWQEEAACQGIDSSIFFHPQNERGSAPFKRDRTAKMVCAQCPVRLECADYHIRAREPYSVWGGLTERDRGHIYLRIYARHHPRRKGDGLRIAGSDVDRTISGSAQGMTA